MSETVSPKRTADYAENFASQAAFKRRRTALACNSCRTRKTRCNGERPCCLPCVELGLECIYENPANGNARGQPSVYDERLRSIEETLRLLVNTRRSTEQLTSPEVSHGHDRSAVALHYNDGDRIAVLQDDHQNAEVDNDDAIDGMASIIDPTDSKARFYGPSSNIAFLRHLSAATSYTLSTIEDQILSSDQPSTQGLISRAPSPENTPSAHSPAIQGQIDVLALPPESQTTHLIESFFNDTGLLFPFVQKSYVLSSYNNAKVKRFAGMRKSFLCLLNSIFAISAHVDGRPEANAETFFQRANVLSSQMDPRMINVEIVQSLLLLIQYRQGTQKSDETWVFLGKAVRIALQLGLHSQSGDTGLSPVEIEVRKRVWYNCIILDRMLSMTFGRPQIIAKEYVKLDLPLNRSLDSLAFNGELLTPQSDAEARETVCFFTATIQLYEVLDFMLATIYDHNLNVKNNTPLPEILKYGLSVEQKLLKWHKELPVELKLRPWSQDWQQTSIIGYDSVFDKLSAIMHLRYLHVSLLHHRAILDRFLESLNVTKHRSFISDTHDPFFLDFARHSLKVCQDSSVEIVDVVWRMSHRTGALGAWWFSAYYTFNACLVMFGCILVHFGLSKEDQCQSNLAAHAVRQHNMSKMIASLNVGVKAIESVGKGTKTAKGIRRTLIKIIQISTRLAQLHGQNGSPDGISHATGTEGIGVRQPMVDEEQQTVDVDQMEALQSSMQAENQWAIPDLQFWTAQNNFNLFADLGSLDAGMGNFMAA